MARRMTSAMATDSGWVVAAGLAVAGVFLLIGLLVTWKKQKLVEAEPLPSDQPGSAPLSETEAMLKSEEPFPSTQPPQPSDRDNPRNAP